MTQDDAIEDEQDRELNELIRQERSKIDAAMINAARRLPPVAPFTELKKRRPGSIAAALEAVRWFIRVKPKRRPGAGREKAIISDFEKRSSHESSS